MIDLNTTQIIGGFVLLSFVAILITTFLQHKTIGSLTEKLIQFSDNKPALDLAETLALKVVPVEWVPKIDAGADLLKQLTPEQYAAFITALKEVFDKLTDGQPNTPAPHVEATPAVTVNVLPNAVG